MTLFHHNDIIILYIKPSLLIILHICEGQWGDIIHRYLNDDMQAASQKLRYAMQTIPEME